MTYRRATSHTLVMLQYSVRGFVSYSQLDERPDDVHVHGCLEKAPIHGGKAHTLAYDAGPLSTCHPSHLEPFSSNFHLSSAVPGILLAKVHAPTVGQCAVHPLNNPTSQDFSHVISHRPITLFLLYLSFKPPFNTRPVQSSPRFSLPLRKKPVWASPNPDFFTLNPPNPTVVLGLPSTYP